MSSTMNEFRSEQKIRNFLDLSDKMLRGNSTTGECEYSSSDSFLTMVTRKFIPHSDAQGVEVDDGSVYLETNQEDSAGEYKEVVVIGNGPSGISLSYFLAGNWPYYNGLGEGVNDMLHYRLLSETRRQRQKDGGDVSVVEQDLTFLSEGLEGRSANPVALLFDTLNHPQADLGLELPSLLNWNYRSSNAINHVVIGQGAPGGAWQSMDGSVLTISLGCWMELPQMNFREWEATQESRCFRESRASVSSVAQYYSDYIKAHHLSKFFRGNSMVTQVRRVPVNKNLPDSCDMALDDSFATQDDERAVRRHTIGETPSNRPKRRSRSLWQVKGFTMKEETKTLEPFAYLTPNVVLATGSSDEPNVLNVPGENLPFVLHSLNDLERLIVSGHLNGGSDPILVVGAGLCAADAIIAAKFHSVPVIHAFRRSIKDPNLIFRQLPQNMYPEYHKVYQMMGDPEGYDNYKALENHVIVEVLPDKRVKVAGPTICCILKVSYLVICIGSHPDLSFLGDVEENIGIQKGKLIDIKRNPVQIDFSTHESMREPGLFALGPLVGENFVRFLQGGALAITSHIVKSKRRKSLTSLVP